MEEKETDARQRWWLRVEIIPYVLFTVIGIAVVYVAGGIILGVVRTGSLLPPPVQLAHYVCRGASGDFSFYYWQGTNRVQIKSASGLLDGTLSQNRFDWNGFANDRQLLGFAPPAEVEFEESTSLRLNGPDLKNVVCTRAATTTVSVAPPTTLAA